MKRKSKWQTLAQRELVKLEALARAKQDARRALTLVSKIKRDLRQMELHLRSLLKQ